jgi:hypothetical protein
MAQHHTRRGAEELLAAVVSSWRGDMSAHEGLVAQLVDRAVRDPAVLPLVRRRLRDAIDMLWERHWTPADVVHVTGRQLTTAHAGLAAAVVVADGRSRAASGEALHARWQAQLDALSTRAAGDHDHAGAAADDGDARATADDTRAVPGDGDAGAAVRMLAALLCLWVRLPEVAATIPSPGAPGVADGADTVGLDDRMLARVRALLAKAESTDFDEEAEALTAKAQQLIARHAIADALLHTPDDVGAPATRRIHIDDPYAWPKAHLLGEIGGANRCRTVFERAYGWATAFGYDHDLDAVELLFASLRTQATRAMVRQGPRRDVRGRSTTKSFRRAFLLGYAGRIGERLRAAGDQPVAEADSGRLLPVLSARDERVRAALSAAFPDAVTRRTSVADGAGWSAGRSAAELADIAVPRGRLDRRPR